MTKIKHILDFNNADIYIERYLPFRMQVGDLVSFAGFISEETEDSLDDFEKALFVNFGFLEIWEIWIGMENNEPFIYCNISVQKKDKEKLRELERQF